MINKNGIEFKFEKTDSGKYLKVYFETVRMFFYDKKHFKNVFGIDLKDIPKGLIEEFLNYIFDEQGFASSKNDCDIIDLEVPIIPFDHVEIVKVKIQGFSRIIDFRN